MTEDLKKLYVLMLEHEGKIAIVENTLDGIYHISLGYKGSLWKEIRRRQSEKIWTTIIVLTPNEAKK